MSSARVDVEMFKNQMEAMRMDVAVYILLLCLYFSSIQLDHHFIPRQFELSHFNVDNT